MIAACSSNRVIGKNNSLIWKVPGDLKRFKELTTGHSVLMGRKTFESIGKALPNRQNIILTRDKNYEVENCLVYNRLDEILSIFEKKNLWVIGGGEIYKQLLPYCDKIELTIIDKEFEGDAFFPELDDNWIIEKKENHRCDEFSYSYITFGKKI